MISNRLLEVVKFIEKDANIIDVGCDHALLGIYLYLNKISVNIIASDASSDALCFAKENLLKYGLCDKIPVVISDGLDKINVNSFDTLVIAGMGGRTIKKIISNKKIYSFSNIIIQPNNNIYEVRKDMVSKGFRISDESLVKFGKRIYTTIKFEKGFEKYTDDELLFGPCLIKQKNKLLKEKIEVEINSFIDVINNKKNRDFIKKIHLFFKIKRYKKYLE